MKSILKKYFKNDELAANVWQGKYAASGEQTPDDMHKRMAKEFARIEKKYIDEEFEFLNPTNKKKFKGIKFFKNVLSKYGFSRKPLKELTIYKLFKDFKYVIPQGSIMATLGTDTIASLSNCWVLDGAKDSYASILKTDANAVFLYKRRGGVGHDISNLRPKGVKTNNTAKSSTGAVSFMHRFSHSTREVAMEGRRGALMLSMDINHPDVMDFIKVKRDGTSVTGANISIKLNDEFMKAVEKNEDYYLRFPVNHPIRPMWRKADIEYNKLYKTPQDGNSSFKKIRAREYWDEIIKSAKNYAEPGLMYWNNVLNNDPASVYEQYKPVCSNPCGEQFLQKLDSCRLMALNLFSFVDNPFTDKAKIDLEKLYEVSYEMMRLGDDLIDLEQEYIQKIIDKIKSDPEDENTKKPELELWQEAYKVAGQGRRVGLGITGLADMLAALNLKYDSDEALEVIETLMKVRFEATLDCNIDLAILRETFEGWDSNKEFVGVNIGVGTNDYYQMILDNFPEQARKMSVFGRRSINTTTIAPTGSVSLIAQVSSGLEPMFQPFYMRRKKVNPGEEGVRVDFTDESGDTWQEFPILHEKFKDWILSRPQREGFIWKNLTKDQLQKWFEQSPWYKSTANDINWKKRVEIQALLQRYTDNAISSTINLPSTVTEKEVSEIYMYGWKKGLKGQTVYVDGSRSGVLVSQKDTNNRTKFEYKDAIKRPKSLICEIHSTFSKGVKYNVIIGLLDNKPYEVFVIPHFTNESKMELIKIKRGRYDLIKECHTYSEDITTEMTDEQEAITRLISTSLRHGADIKFLVEQLNKTTGSLFGFTGSLARVLKKYIPEGAKSTIICNECNSNSVIFEEGCSKCLDCGSSACG